VPLVHVTRRLPAPGIEPLRSAGFTVDLHDDDLPPPRHELLARVAPADGLVCTLTERVDAEVLDAAPGLRVVANLAVGIDNVDLEAAADRGVVVTNTPGVLTEASADLAWTLLLAAARRVPEGDRLVRSGTWAGWAPAELLGRPVWGTTLGIIGMGAIGTAVARRARGFGMTVLYHNRRRAPAAEAEVGATYVSLDELFERSDVVSIHTPLNAESRHLVDAAALAKMKRTAVLVNVGRGPVVDEAALVEALRSGEIAAAGLDVYEREPELAAGLAELDNVVLMPHAGSATAAARAAMVDLACANVVAVLQGRPALTPVAPG
jgi:glyoxylate reductase